LVLKLPGKKLRPGLFATFVKSKIQRFSVFVWLRDRRISPIGVDGDSPGYILSAGPNQPCSVFVTLKDKSINDYQLFRIDGKLIRVIRGGMVMTVDDSDDMRCNVNPERSDPLQEMDITLL
jgi:hypothetical protein